MVPNATPRRFEMTTRNPDSYQSSSSEEKEEEKPLLRRRVLRRGSKTASTKFITEFANVIRHQPGSFQESNILARLEVFAQSLKQKQGYTFLFYKKQTFFFQPGCS